MQTLRRVWEHLEEGFIAFLLAAMTLVTFVYVMLNNIYTLFFACLLYTSPSPRD